MYALIAGVVVFFAGIVTATAFFIAFIRVDNTSRRKPQRTKAKQEARHKFEYSKFILALVLVTYFIGVGVGMYAVIKILLDYPEWAIQALIALLGYIGTPTVTAIGFYAWKARAENTIKIKKENPTETEGIPVDLNNINV